MQARSGRLVVDRVQRFDGSEGRAALALMLAAPAPATTWAFPEGHHRADLVERWHVYNPGADEALVSLELVPDSEDEPEPLDVPTSPHRWAAWPLRTRRGA